MTRSAGISDRNRAMACAGAWPMHPDDGVQAASRPPLWLDSPSQSCFVKRHWPGQPNNRAHVDRLCSDGNTSASPPSREPLRAAILGSRRLLKARPRSPCSDNTCFVAHASSVQKASISCSSCWLAVSHQAKGALLVMLRRQPYIPLAFPSLLQHTTPRPCCAPMVCSCPVLR